jgi:hypothetical protein
MATLDVKYEVKSSFKWLGYSTTQRLLSHQKRLAQDDDAQTLEDA